MQSVKLLTLLHNGEGTISGFRIEMQPCRQIEETQALKIIATGGVVLIVVLAVTVAV